MKLLKTIAASALVLSMGSALAAEPVTLDETQMDKVSAGSSDIRNDLRDISHDLTQVPINWKDIRCDIKDFLHDLSVHSNHFHPL
ncbi:MAG: hypothetical protein ACXWF8_12785 [Methylobacter sp.]